MAWITFSDQYKTPLRFALVEMWMVGFPSLFVLDTGVLVSICFRAVIVYAAMLLLVLLRRPAAPTQFDLLVLKWGFPALYLVCFVVYTPFLRSRGFF